MKNVHAYKWMKKHIKRVTLRFTTAVCTSNDSLNNLSLVLFFRFFKLYSLSFSLTLYIWWAKAKILNARRDDTKCVWKKKETNERTNEHRFCLYSSYSRRTNHRIYIFFLSPTIKSVVAERSTLCLCSYMHSSSSFIS